MLNYTVEEEIEGRKVTLRTLVDSGAAENVIPTLQELLRKDTVQDSDKKIVTYATAAGEKTKNQGKPSFIRLRKRL